MLTNKWRRLWPLSTMTKRNDEIQEQLTEIRQGLEQLNRNLTALIYTFIGKEAPGEERNAPMAKLSLHQEDTWRKYVG